MVHQLSHAVFLDLYLSDSVEGFAPPKPFTLDELDPTGILPDRVYTKLELLNYLEHCREKCRVKLENLTEENANQLFSGFGFTHYTMLELQLSNMRHVQHHAAQLNLLLRQKTDSAPNWVGKTKHKLNQT